MESIKTEVFLVAAVFSALLFISVAGVSAQTPSNTSSSASANTTCSDWWGRCQGQPCQNTPPKFSTQQQGGTVSGQCVQTEFRADSFTDTQGETTGLQDAMKFMQQALGTLQSLLGGGESSPSGGGSSPTGSVPTSDSGLDPNLSQNAQASTETSSDPASDILQQVFSNKAKEITVVGEEIKEPSGSFLEAVASGFGNITNKITEVTVGITDKSANQKVTPSLPDVDVKKIRQERSEVRTVDGGATIEISTEEESIGVSGFYGVIGGNIPDSKSLSLVGRLCVTRPWAGGIISNLIPSTFFDNLCTRGGYHVGPWPEIGQDPVNVTQVVRQAALRSDEAEEPIERKTVGISCLPEVIRQGSAAALAWSCGTGERLLGTGGFTASENETTLIVTPSKTASYSISCSNDFEDSCTITVINPRVAIWAEPEAVRLGSRTLVYWNTQDVDEDSCEVNGPSFHEYGPYGGASTVALNDHTSYTVTCTALDGQEVSETILVELAF